MPAEESLTLHSKVQGNSLHKTRAHIVMLTEMKYNEVAIGVL